MFGKIGKISNSFNKFKNKSKSVYKNELKNKNITILVCEDDVESKTTLVKVLHKLGVNNIVMFDNTKMVEDYLSHPNIFPDIILLDIQMPSGYINGDDLCIKLRKKGVKTPIIAVTGTVKATGIENLLRKGFDSVITKPYTIGRLVSSINRNIS